jgi:lipopolysaccharide transport system permease protein
MNSMGKHILALLRARDILFTWTVREVKVRYTDTSLGLAWIVLYPAAWVLLFTLLFSHLVPVPVQGVPYPLFVMSGLVPWFFFSSTVSNAVSSLKNNANLIPKVYFPREILPLGSVLLGLLDLAFYLLLLLAAMLFFHVGGGIKLIMLLPIVLSLTALTLGISLLTARLALFRREVQLLVPMALQFLMYMVPVFYPVEIVPVRLRLLYLLNPLASLMDSFRHILIYGRWPDWRAFGYAAFVSFALLIFAYWDFKRAEPEFADRL